MSQEYRLSKSIFFGGREEKEVIGQGLGVYVSYRRSPSKTEGNPGYPQSERLTTGLDCLPPQRRSTVNGSRH